MSNRRLLLSWRLQPQAWNLLNRPEVKLHSNCLDNEILSGRWDVSDVEQRMLKEHVEKYGIDLKTFKSRRRCRSSGEPEIKFNAISKTEGKEEMVFFEGDYQNQNIKT